MSRPKALEYVVDHWEVHKYYELGGRNESSVTVIVTWAGKIPEDVRKNYFSDYHTVRTSKNCPTLKEAIEWLNKEIESNELNAG